MKRSRLVQTCTYLRARAQPDRSNPVILKKTIRKGRVNNNKEKMDKHVCLRKEPRKEMKKMKVRWFNNDSTARVVITRAGTPINADEEVEWKYLGLQVTLRSES
jgi:hypothetical protein